ncbi:MAG TPA: rhomboid family intramembrane serine protease [Candidatus Brocadiia bacterium]|nr:rhomboid family intramembrane serine protease [Candidatus Brocadiia bacterium]
MIPIHDENRSRTTPYVVAILILVNLAVFVNEATMNEREIRAFITGYGMTPGATVDAVKSFRIFSIHSGWTFITSMFLHASWWHLIGNMWFLWLFGDNVEDYLGHLRFIVFYLFSGFAAGLAHFMMDPMSQIPCVGASGAISGILGAYALLFPRARIVCFLPSLSILIRFRIRAVFFMGVWFLFQMIPGVIVLSLPKGAGIAYWAHIGGFMFGMFLTANFRRRKKQIEDNPIIGGVKYYKCPEDGEDWHKDAKKALFGRGKKSD